MNTPAHSYLTYGRQLIRREQTYSGGGDAAGAPRVNDNQLTYKYTANGWQNYEEREDWSGGVFANRYDITQVYDKNGNRTGYDKNVQSGHETTYGNPTNLTTTFDNINRPTAVSDADDAGYSCTITNDPNMNITQIEETKTSGSDSSTIYSYFDVDALNRMTSNRVKWSDNGTWNKDAPRTARIKRQHELSATGAILKSTYKAWNDGSGEPAGDSLHHSWGQDGKHIQNTDTNGSSFGKPWHWAGAANNHGGPLHNPNADTASQSAYNVGAAGGAGTPSRWSYVNPTTSGDSRELWGQGQPEAKDSVNDWRYGKKSKAAVGVFPEIESRFAYFGTVAPTDLDRATDVREKGRISFFGSGYSYAGSSPRVTSEKIGRDINPLGRGGGAALVGGMLNVGQIAPRLPWNHSQNGTGSSVNNPCCGAARYEPPTEDPLPIHFAKGCDPYWWEGLKKEENPGPDNTWPNNVSQRGGDCWNYLNWSSEGVNLFTPLIGESYGEKCADTFPINGDPVTYALFWGRNACGCTPHCARMRGVQQPGGGPPSPQPVASSCPKYLHLCIKVVREEIQYPCKCCLEEWDSVPFSAIAPKSCYFRVISTVHKKAPYTDDKPGTPVGWCPQHIGDEYNICCSGPACTFSKVETQVIPAFLDAGVPKSCLIDWTAVLLNRRQGVGQRTSEEECEQCNCYAEFSKRIKKLQKMYRGHFLPTSGCHRDGCV